MAIFQAAASGANLSPMARAVLRFVEGLVVAALVVVLPVLGQLLATQLNAGAINWTQVGTVALSGFVFALLMALSKWAKAHGDAPLADAAQALAGSVANAGGLSSDVVAELDAATLPDTPDAGPLGIVGTLATAADGTVAPIVSVAALGTIPAEVAPVDVVAGASS